jgi:phytoene synthase
VTGYRLSRSHFDTLIDAREADLDETGPATTGDLLGYAEATAAPLVGLALEVLGAGDEASVQAGREVGIAWALTGLLRAMPFHLAQRRVMLPADLLGRHGLTAGRLLDWHPDPDTLAPAVAELAGLARQHLVAARQQAERVAVAAHPALLLATLADLHLDVLARHGHNPFAPAVQARHPARPLRLAWQAWRRRW